MTPEEFTNQLPLLTNNPLPIKPPFLFNGVSVRIFPLRASLDALQQLVDGYMNFIPPEAGRFRVATPYVMLEVLDYGEIGESVSRIGWFAQTEVFFSLNVEWYKLVDGEWVFQDWAVITPYIFVNDNFSVPLGRTVYGFPKVLAELTEVRPEWPRNPVAPVTLARLKTQVFPEAYAGKRLENQVLLEIERDAPMSNFRVPPDPLSPAMPWVLASNLAKAFGGFSMDAMWMAQSMRISPVGPLSPGNLAQMLGRFLPALSPLGEGFVTNSLNLKQFRRADDPMKICYQALTNGQMFITGFNGGGLLGEERSFAGDLSGGHTVRLFEHSSLHLVQTLGLEVHRSYMGPGGVTVAEVKPLMPMWIDINLKYERGTNVAWRGADGVWKDNCGVPYPKPKLGLPQAEAEEPVFNSTVASTVEAIAGPFSYSGATIRVLPLLAQTQKLQRFVDTFINDAIAGPLQRTDGKGAEQMRLRVWARPAAVVNSSGTEVGGDLGYVYLTSTSFDGVTSPTNNVGDWAKSELSFLIPVKWERRKSDESWETVAVGMVPAFTMVDGCIAAISRFEVQGIDARTAEFIRPESVWLGETGSGKGDLKQALLLVNAEVWPAYGAGQKAVMKTVIEISHRDSEEGVGDAESRETAFAWAQKLRMELGTKKATKARFPEDCKVARALALEVLGNKTSFSLFTMKQIRDVSDPDKACFQELVRVPRRLQEVFDIQEIEETLAVRLVDFPGLDIHEQLGILAVPSHDRGDGLSFRAQPIRPFFIRATMEEPLAERLLARTRSSSWTMLDGAMQSILSDEPWSDPIVADRKAETLQDQIDPSWMTAVVFEARQRFLAPSGGPISKKRARAALEIADPQMIIESILSREWGSQKPDARWRRGRRELLDLFAALPSGGDVDAYAQSMMYLDHNNELAVRPGSVAEAATWREWVPPDSAAKPANAGEQPAWGRLWSVTLEGIIASEEEFTRLRFRMENDFNLLSSFEILGLAGLAKFSESPKSKPTAKTVRDAQQRLLQTLVTLNKMKIKGEPSERNNLDTFVLANKTRMEFLLVELVNKYKDWCELTLEPAASEVVVFREVVELARGFCFGQRDALLNKLSRAYQKPDYCVRRDSVGPGADRLLPVSLSWDEEWYFGKEITAAELPPDDRKKTWEADETAPGESSAPARKAVRKKSAGRKRAAR